MSSKSFEGGFSVLPPILSARNSEEKLAIHSNNVDVNGNSTAVNNNNVSEISNCLDKNSNSASKDLISGSEGTQSNGIDLPRAPFSSILPQSLHLTFEDR